MKIMTHSCVCLMTFQSVSFVKFVAFKMEPFWIGFHGPSCTSSQCLSFKHDFFLGAWRTLFTYAGNACLVGITILYMKQAHIQLFVTGVIHNLPSLRPGFELAPQWEYYVIASTPLTAQPENKFWVTKSYILSWTIESHYIKSFLPYLKKQWLTLVNINIF